MSIAASLLPDAALLPELAWLAPFLRPTLPPQWQPWTSAETGNGRGWRARTSIGAGLAVMLSGAVELDGRRWVHVSLSRRDRMPSYDDMALVKRVFIGADRKAVQVFPQRREHYSLHEFCLHLWHCVDGDGLPDFRAQGGV